MSDLVEITHTMMSGGYPGEPPTNILTVDMPGPDMPALTDWRRQPINVGTMVIWRGGAGMFGGWRIGRVTAIRREEGPGAGYSDLVLDLEWTEQASEHTIRSTTGKARGVQPYNVTVWPGGAS